MSANSSSSSSSSSNNGNNNNNTTNKVIKTIQPPTQKKEYFRWLIEDWSHLREDPLNKYYSPNFSLGGNTWRILLFPNGRSPPTSHVSAYLAVAEQHTLPTGWDREASFYLTSPLATNSKPVRHHFNSRTSDWGFQDFVPIHNPHNPHTHPKDDILSIDVTVEIHNQVINASPFLDQYFPAAAKTLKESGYAGPLSDGALQYVNSALMFLFHLAFVRRAVYRLETDNDPIHSTLQIAMQRFFFQLQSAKNSGIDQRFIVNFLGWTEFDSWNPERNLSSFFPHFFQSLFGTANLPEIVHITLDTSIFSDELQQLSLTASTSGAAFPSVIEGFFQSSDVEPPAVIAVHLDRFTHNSFGFKTKTTAAVPYTPTVSVAGYDYQLFSVFVHNGSVYGGHFNCFIKPPPAATSGSSSEQGGASTSTSTSTSSRWFKFDDELVVAVDDEQREVFEKNFGGKNLSTSQAYFLAYIRSDSIANASAIAPLEATPLPEALASRFQAQEEADFRQHLEDLEVLLWMEIRVATSESMLCHDQSKLGLVDFETVPTYRVKKNMSLADFKNAIQQDFNIPADRQRIWSWGLRENGTFRIESYIRPEEEEQDICHSTNESVWNIFLENIDQTDVVRNTARNERSILLLLKYYDPTQIEPLQFVTSVLCERFQLVRDLQQICQQSVPIEGAFHFYEEVSPHLVEELVPTSTIGDAGLQNGDIVVFQIAPNKSAPSRHPPCCIEWYKYLADRTEVRLLPHPESPHASLFSSIGEFSLQLRTSMSYEDVVNVLATVLSDKRGAVVNPQTIRLTGYNPLLQKQRSAPYFPAHDLRLPDLLEYHFAPSHPILYYEITRFTMAEYEDSNPLVIEWQGTLHEILVPKSLTIADATQKFAQSLPSPPTGNLTLVVISPADQSVSEISPSTPIASIDLNVKYRAIQS